MTKKGKLIVFYGINNLGKTTQAKMLVDWLNSIDVSDIIKTFKTKPYDKR